MTAVFSAPQVGYEKDPDQKGSLHRMRAVPRLLRNPAFQLQGHSQSFSQGICQAYTEA
jgi:hypothetical protein